MGEPDLDRRLYLFRIDDVCHQIKNETLLRRLLEIFAQYQVVPLVGVVPCNQDKTLCSDSSTYRLEELKPLIAKKAVEISLHGYTHQYENQEGGIWRLALDSEFAGVPEELQQERLQKGVDAVERILGVTPKFFFAPSHSYDVTTLRVLTKLKMSVSDGIALYPFYLEGVWHVPAQLWGFKIKGPGVWTIVIHPQQIEEAYLKDLTHFLSRYRSDVGNYTPDSLNPYREIIRTPSLKIKEYLFRQVFYLRLHLYHSRQNLLRLMKKM